MKAPKPPPHLSAEASKWWTKLVNDFAIDDAAALLLLQTALEAFSRMREAQAAIDRDGASFTDRFGQVKAHPLLPAERDSRNQMLAALKQLNLDVEPLRDGPGRPPGR